MSDVTTIIPGVSDGQFVECGAPSGLKPQGKVFRKPILKWGSFVHPKDKSKRITVDKDFADRLIKNFRSKASGVVQFPVVNSKNEHVEDPMRNLGEVVDIDYDDQGINAYIDVRDHADKIGKTIIGASAMMHLDYERHSDGSRIGPTLLHVAATNRPYITDLDGFSEVLAASADTPDEAVLMEAEDEAPEDSDPPESESEAPKPKKKKSKKAAAKAESVEPDPAPEGEEMPKSKEELIAELRDQHGIDVAALEEAARTAEEMATLSASLGNEDDELTVRDVAAAVLELSQKNEEQSELIATLSARNDEMEQKAAEQLVDGLISAGKVLPRQREVMITLSRTQPEVFEQLIPDEAIVSLSEEGVTTHQKSNADEVNSEIDRITSAMKEYLGR